MTTKSQFATSLEKLDPEQFERVKADMLSEEQRRGGGEQPRSYAYMSDHDLQQAIMDAQRKAKNNG
jgi:hypothetical protein